MKLFDPAVPRTARALLTLCYAKKFNAKTPNRVPQATIDAAGKHLCASGVSYQRVQKALRRGGNTPAEIATAVNACYPTLPIVPPPP